jgi:hypothetical protein
VEEIIDYRDRSRPFIVVVAVKCLDFEYSISDIRSLNDDDRMKG